MLVLKLLLMLQWLLYVQLLDRPFDTRRVVPGHEEGQGIYEMLHFMTFRNLLCGNSHKILISAQWEKQDLIQSHCR